MKTLKLLKPSAREYKSAELSVCECMHMDENHFSLGVAKIKSNCNCKVPPTYINELLIIWLRGSFNYLKAICIVKQILSV